MDECIRRGSHPDDRDCLTDMTLLMYAYKAGANGVGDQQAAANVGYALHFIQFAFSLTQFFNDSHFL